MHPRHNAEGQRKQGTPSTDRERMKETRRRMTECRHTEIPPTLSVEKLEKIKKQTQEKEQADQSRAFKIKLILGLVILVLLLLCGFLL